MKVCYHSSLAFVSEGRLLMVKALKSQWEIPYRGILIDDRLSFKSHLEKASKNLRITQIALSHLLRNIGGLRS